MVPSVSVLTGFDCTVYVHFYESLYIYSSILILNLNEICSSPIPWSDLMQAYANTVFFFALQNVGIAPLFILLIR